MQFLLSSKHLLPVNSNLRECPYPQRIADSCICLAIYGNPFAGEVRRFLWISGSFVPKIFQLKQTGVVRSTPAGSLYMSRTAVFFAFAVAHEDFDVPHLNIGTAQPGQRSKQQSCEIKDHQ